MRSSITRQPTEEDFLKLAKQTGCSVSQLREEWDDIVAESWSDDQAEINHENGLPWPMEVVNA